MSASQKLLEYIETAADEKPDVAIQEIQSLVQKGADLNYFHQETGQSVMHKVAVHWDKDLASLLYKNVLQSFKKYVDVSVMDMHGITPLHEAVRTNNTEMVEWLLKQKAKLEIKTLTGNQTPLHYAARFDSIEALQLLLHAGGNILL